MSLFLDIWQNWRLSENEGYADDLDGRVKRLERQLKETRAVIRELVARLEQRLGEDLNDNGRVG